MKDHTTNCLYKGSMAGWSMTTDLPSLDCSGTPNKHKSTGSWIDLEPSSEVSIAQSEPDNLSLWFNKFLGQFLKEICSCIWPLPPMLDGQPVELLKLFLVVREKGGYNAVSRSGSWNVVTKESGLGLNVASSVKPVYVKYLVSLERWLENIVESKDWKGESNFNRHLVEFGAELEQFLLKSSKKFVEYSQDSVMAGSDQGDDSTSAKKGIDANQSEEVKTAVKEDSLEIITESDDIKEDSPSHKRKRNSVWEMLVWVTEVAKDPCNPVLGSLPEVSKWNSYGIEELWKQVLLFREFFFIKKEDLSSADQSSSQKSQNMHPSMYEEKHISGYNLRERSSGTSMDETDYDGPPIGPRFQADVPEWTGEASESDPKWSGIRTWPLDKEEKRLLIERDPIGKGRQDSCGCPIRDSIQCVQFHVSAKISTLKFEVGSAFYEWRFDSMGEKVAVGWEKAEQRKFYTIVKSNPPQIFLGEEINKCFPNKSREELVSYYYNVLILQRRANQNQNPPININSDDFLLTYNSDDEVKSKRYYLPPKKKSYKGKGKGKESDAKTEKKLKKTH